MKRKLTIISYIIALQKEIDNDYIYIVESTPTENDIVNLNLNAGETKKEYYKYSRKTHSFFKDFFLKRAETYF